MGRRGAELFIAGFLMLLLAQPSQAQASLDAPINECSAGRFFSALEKFRGLPAADRDTGEGNYVAGHICEFMNLPDKAEAYFQRASAMNFRGYDTWGLTKDRLASLVTLRSLRPPIYSTINQNGTTVTVYSRQTPWAQRITSYIPKFISYAESYFGAPLPPFTFYFFSRRADFDSFHAKLLHAPVIQSWHDGTGNFNVVLFCEVDRYGKVTRSMEQTRTLGDVLHEYGHGLCATIYGDDYLNKVPQWFNEGIADALAGPYFSEVYYDADKYIREQATIRQPPSYETLSKALYQDHEMGYAFGRMMVKEILASNQRPAVGRLILEAARKSDFDSAIRTVTGVAPLDAYNRVVRRYWASH